MKGKSFAVVRRALLVVAVVLTIAVATFVASCGAPTRGNAQGTQVGTITQIGGDFGRYGSYDSYEIEGQQLVCMAITSQESGGQTGGPVAMGCAKK